MNTIKTTIVIGALVAGSLTAYAQPAYRTGGPEGGPENRRERIEAQKIAMITRELNLTPKEAQVFWPVYNQAEEERKGLRKKRKAPKGPKPKEGETRKTIETMSDQEVETMMNDMMAHEQAELDLKTKYLEKYKEVLPVKKVAKLYRAEKKFKRKLMADIKERGQRRGPRTPQSPKTPNRPQER